MTIMILPPNSTKMEQVLEQATARIERTPHPLETLWNPETCPERILPWLAWGLSVDDWNPAWPEKIQRQVIASALKVHRYKGTPAAVRLAVDALDYDGFGIVEWFERTPKRAPYTFRFDVEVIERGLDADDWQSLRAVIWNAKNLRSHMEGIQLTIRRQDKIPILAAALIPGNTTTVYPKALRVRIMQSPHRFGLGLHLAAIKTVYPRSKHV